MCCSYLFIIPIILMSLLEYTEANESFVAIDFGSDELSVAVFYKNQVEIVKNKAKNMNYPNILSVATDGIIFGDEALNFSYIHPERMICDVKRIIGKEFKDISNQPYIKYWNYRVTSLEGNPYIEIQLNDTMVQLFTPEELFTETLLRIGKLISSKFKDFDFDKLILTIPSSFNNFQRKSIIDASKQSKFKQIYLISNPSSIILGYLNDIPMEIIHPNIFILIDFGSVNIDIGIIQVNPDVNGNSYSINIIGSYSNNDIGGRDFDNNVLEYYMNKIRISNNKYIENNVTAKYRLLREIRRVKKELSEKYITNIDIVNLCEGMDFNVKVSRAEFEVINEDLFRRIPDMISKILDDTKMNMEQIDKIVLSGGSSNFMKFRDLIKGYFLNKEIIYLTEMKNNRQSEYNVIGAALYGDIVINRNDSKFIFTNTLPYSIGTDQTDDLMDVIIQKNTPVPISTTRTYTTGEDNQTLITISIFQGENKLINDNVFLIEYIINDLPPVKAGVINIEVEFMVDINGILSIKAKDLLFNSTLNITSSNRLLSSIDIYRIIHEKEEREKEELKRKEDEKKKVEIIEYSYYINRTIKSTTTMCRYDKYLLEKRILKTIQWFDANINNNDLEEYDRRKTELVITEQTIKTLSEYVCQDSVNVKSENKEKYNDNSNGNNSNSNNNKDNSSLKDIRKILYRIDSNYKKKLKKLDDTTVELKMLQQTLFKLINDYSNNATSNQTNRINNSATIGMNNSTNKNDDKKIQIIQRQLEELQFTVPIMMNDFVYQFIAIVIVIVCCNLLCFAFIYYKRVPSTEEIVKELNKSYSKGLSPKSVIKRRKSLSITPVPSSTRKSPHVSIKTTPQKKSPSSSDGNNNNCNDEEKEEDHFAVPNPKTIKKVHCMKNFSNNILEIDNHFYESDDENYSMFNTPLSTPSSTPKLSTLSSSTKKPFSRSSSICGEESDIICFDDNNNGENNENRSYKEDDNMQLVIKENVIERKTNPILQKLKTFCDCVIYYITFGYSLSITELLIVVIVFSLTLFILIQLGLY